MTRERIHRTHSADGTEIAARVHGQGPPLVLVHGILEDGDQCWSTLVPLLRERFTCFLMSTRGRGLSGAHPDVREERLVEDVTAFVESVGEPVRLVGESSGGAHALGAAGRTDAVIAMAVHEPVVPEVMSDDLAARLEQTTAHLHDAIARDDRMGAARTFFDMICTQEERTAVETSGYCAESARYMPLVLEELSSSAHDTGYSPTDPSVLARITAPILVMHGERTALADWFGAGAHHVATHVPRAVVRELRGTGHLAPFLHPEPLAHEILRFLDEAASP